jgi:hypothetical protein
MEDATLVTAVQIAGAALNFYRLLMIAPEETV